MAPTARLAGQGDRRWPPRRRWGPQRAIAALALAAFLLAAPACGNDDGGADEATAPAVSAAGYPLTITDDSGADLVIAALPQRVITVLPSVSNYLLDLGLAAAIVGSDDFTLEDYATPDNALLAHARSVGGQGFTFNLEAVVELDPDLVFSAEGGDFTQRIRELGYPVVEIFFPASIEENLQDLLLVGRIFGVEDEAQALVADLRERLAAIGADAGRRAGVRVYMEIDQSTPTQPFTVGPGSLQQEMIEAAGGRNVFADAESAFPQVGWEAVISADPDLILLLDSTEEAGAGQLNTVSVPEVGQRTGWDNITAVREGHVVPMDPDDFSSGARLLDAVEAIVAAIDGVVEARAERE